jgi:hypothetical protein
MTWDELVSAVKQVKLIEMRGQKDKYLEVVVAVDDLAPVTDLFNTYFGAPFKATGDRPSREADVYAGPFGGVQTGQMLYIKKVEDLVQGALLWPWGNGSSVTVKIFS